MSETKLPVLYKYSTTGKAQQWQIIVEDDKFYTIEGQVGGKLTTSLPTICKAKNVGRANATTPEQQAMSEAKAKHQKKLDKGYNEVLTDEKKFFEPMLAKDYKDRKDVWADPKIKKYVQPKLDGLRCVNENNQLMSRNGKPYLACPHLVQNDTILDGELYNHSLKNDFNKIVSLCKKQDPDKNELLESKNTVQFWVYDFPSHKGKFSDRYMALKKWIVKHNNPAFVLVPTYEVHSEADLKKRHEEFLEMGFEGTIVRLDLGEYENKRSNQLLKYKDFTDEEFEITGAEEGTGGRAGTIGFFNMVTQDGKPFKSNVKGDFDYLKDIWRNHQAYIGKKATVKYFNLTPAGIPRFPYIIKLNRAEYE